MSWKPSAGEKFPFNPHLILSNWICCSVENWLHSAQGSDPYKSRNQKRYSCVNVLFSFIYLLMHLCIAYFATCFLFGLKYGISEAQYGEHEILEGLYRSNLATRSSCQDQLEMLCDSESCSQAWSCCTCGHCQSKDKIAQVNPLWEGQPKELKQLKDEFNGFI